LGLFVGRFSGKILGVVGLDKTATLTGFFRGGSGKKRVLVVVLCGPFVVLCVVSVVVQQPYLELQKMRHGFRLFFIPCTASGLFAYYLALTYRHQRHQRSLSSHA
jgi:hypothetical protein